MITVYGISNCDTVRKARKFLEAQGITYRFHDFRKDGLSPDTITNWCAAVGAAALVNTRSTSFRALSDADKARAKAADPALLAETPTLIKRPVCVGAWGVLVGFQQAIWEEKLVAS
jgi:Spx/MgsR family transcriptional regulator